MAQWVKTTQKFGQHSNTVFEVVMLGDKNGRPVQNSNPLPVTGTTLNHLNNQVLRIDDDTVQHTSRNRRKVSDQSILWFNNVQFDTDLRSFDISSANSVANVEFSQFDGALVLQVANTAGAEVIRQSRAVVPYYPGRQNEIVSSLKFTTPQEGIRRRVGLFDANNGIFFEDDGGTYACVIRRNTASGPVEDRVTRDNWNVDKLDGTGQSRITANSEAVQMITIEYEHFGAGQVEFNWIYNNNKYPIHQFETSNQSAFFWSNTPFLPIRQELTNVTGASGTHRFYIGSTAVATEGTTGPVGRENSAASRITGFALGSSANVFKPVLAIRLKSDRLSGVVYPSEFQAATLDNTNIFYRVIENATYSANGGWVSAGDESFVEYNSNTASTFSGGDIIQQGFINGEGQGAFIKFPEDAIRILKRKNLGTESENLVIAIASAANKDAFATISWVELR